MEKNQNEIWGNRLVAPETVLDKLEPGMTIFLSTGAAEPRTLLKKLIYSEHYTISDLELIQIFSFGEAISTKEIKSQRYRLKTFFKGWFADEAISSGRVDLIPGFFSQIPDLIGSGQISIDVAFIQITPPNAAGYCSLGISMDAARQAMQQAKLVVGEINHQIPLTFGDTFVPHSDFNFVIQSDEPPIYYDRVKPDPIFEQIAANVASVIENGSCLAYSIGPLFEALTKFLVNKKDLGIHTPFFTDALMDLCKSSAVSNRKKAIFKGKSLTSYALGTPELMTWLHNNPMVEFQGIDKVCNPLSIGQNSRFMAIVPCRKVDISGRIVLFSGKANTGATPGEVGNLSTAARISPGGLTIFALPSRNLEKKSNILMSLEGYDEQFAIKEAVDLVITEYGIAYLCGRTVRERAQALVEIAHPEDRKQLVELAKEKRILFQDQIFLADSSFFYPSEISETHVFKNDLNVRFRAIRPSDEEQMRRLFYRFSDEAVYYRYFTPIKAMPHSKMQMYVNVDYSEVMSIVGLIGPVGKGQMIAEARYVRHKDKPLADIAFVVDEKYHGLGIATYLYRFLTRLAKQKGLQGFTANVLTSNTAMMKVFEKEGTVKAKIESGEYELMITFP
ncbi:GNAT family N-acetyltransferase [bacterium]|nr:GNAT family N-acetyltransferase [bacterium]